MQELKPCPQCGAAAALQVKGELGLGDYYQDRQDPPMMFPWGPGKLVNGKIEKPVPYFKLIERDPGDEDDLRIACTVCARETGWSKNYIQTIKNWNSHRHGDSA